MKLTSLYIFTVTEDVAEEQLHCHAVFDNGMIHAVRNPVPTSPAELRKILTDFATAVSDWYECSPIAIGARNETD